MTAEQRKILAVMLVPMFMSLLSVSIVNVIFPGMQRSIGASNSAIQWVLSGYTLAFGVLLVAAGRAGDLFGRGRLFVIGVAVFALGSLISGLSPDPLVLNIARVVMGLGSGLLSPQGVGMLQQYFHGQVRGRAYGMFGTIVGVSVGIGPVLGGGLIAVLGDEWGWRSAFLINVPIALAAIILGRFWLPKSAWLGTGTESASHGRRRADFDPVGLVLLGVGTLLVMLPFLERSAGAWIYALVPVGVAVVWLWVRWENRYSRRGGSPMVDMQLFRTRSFAYGASLTSMYFVGMPGIWVIVALYLQNGLGFPALHAGLVGLPSALLSAIAAQAAGRVVLTFGRKMVVLGVAIGLTGVVASALLVLAHEAWGISIWWLLLTLGITGLGQGMAISPNQTLTLAEVPVEYAGSSGGVMQTGQRVGTAIGIAIVTAVFFVVQPMAGYGAAIVAGFGFIALVIVFAGIIGLVDLARGRAKARQEGPPVRN
ncbi:drug resistance transporter, EmrB/QacA subfamily [Brevibacterium linens ATCC 9172]|uniref:Drug resistance transporter, EmrB/QacA subfamily n=2 Tax=Brevibacterium linens TaxID=1703 RepID=A0A2H1JDI2_BRELN|nr:drug resistance transporter, EmrB/QacA subfamily [Brevibacterium linens ATCC 9172]